MSTTSCSADTRVASQDPTTALPQLECTSHMVSSFIFSKPGFSLAPFVSWQSSAKVPVDPRRNQRPHAVSRSPPQPTRETHPQSRRTDATPTALPASRPDAALWNLHLRSVAWKRRSFVEAVERVPLAYQHRSVVPSVRMSPRVLEAYHAAGLPPHSSGDALSPEGGVAPQVTSDVPRGHPVHRAQAFIANVHQQATQEAHRCRDALAQRVVHVQDTEVHHVIDPKRRPVQSAPAARCGEQTSHDTVSHSKPACYGEDAPSVGGSIHPTALTRSDIATPADAVASGAAAPRSAVENCRQPLPVGIRRRSAPTRPAAVPSGPS